MICRKQKYSSKKDAKLAIKLLTKLGANGYYKKGKLVKRKRLRPYICKRCSTKTETVWHLTSSK